MKPTKRHEIPLNDPQLFTANPVMLEFLENDPLKLTEATASFFITSRRLDIQVPKVVSKLTIPVYLFLAEHDRIIDNKATIELLQPALKGIGESGKSTTIYKGAHHTLDFEVEPGEFFSELARILALFQKRW